MMELRFGIILFALVILQESLIKGTAMFNKKLTGVAYAPYIAEKRGPEPSGSLYTVENVLTMLQIASTQFTNIMTCCLDVHASVTHYKPNYTYYYKANVRVRTAEVAAYMNRERNNLSLAVTVGIFMNNINETMFDTQAKVAVEAAQVAHLMFPGTLRGFVLYDTTDYLVEINKARELLEWIKRLRQLSSNLNISIGIQLSCKNSFRRSVLPTGPPGLLNVKKEILSNLDFIVCFSVPNDFTFNNKGAAAAFDEVKAQFVKQRDDIKFINNNIQVMWNTWMLKPEVVKMDDANYKTMLREYWLEVDKFATQYNYPGWLYPAFGFLRKNDMGWWQLTDQSKINDASAYEESTSVLPVVEKDEKRNDMITSATTVEYKNDIQTSFTDSTLHTSSDESSTIILATTQFNFAEIKDNEKVADQETNQTLAWGRNEIIIGTVLSALILSWIIFKIIKRLKKRKSSESGFQILTRQEIDEFTYGTRENAYEGQTYGETFVNENALKLPYDRLLEIPKDKIKIVPKILIHNGVIVKKRVPIMTSFTKLSVADQILGGGEFGCVFKAIVILEADHETEVALKMVKPNAGATAIKGLLSEIKILSYLGQHPNIVPILGAYTAEITKGTVYIASELCPLGSLKNCLKKCRDETVQSDTSTVPINDMIRWSYEIACGMAYLGQKGVIHADLATRNVLLSSESIAKISDFGLSRRLYEYTNYTKTSQEPLPWRWMAFESLKAMEFSTKSDVWSYGVTLREIFSLGAQPYPGIAWSLDFVETLEDGFRLRKPKYATSEIFEVMEKCWKLQPRARPSFTELKNSMRQIQNNANDGFYTLVACPMDERSNCQQFIETNITSNISHMIKVPVSKEGEGYFQY